MEQLLISLFGEHAVTISIWVFVSLIFAAFAGGARLMYILTAETKIIKRRLHIREVEDEAQRQAIDELKRVVEVLQTEDKALDARVSAANIILTGATAKRLGL